MPSAWIISEPCAILVPVKKPESVAVSITVMIVLPPERVMLRMVKDAAKLPLTVVGVVAFASGMKSRGSVSIASNALFIFPRTAVLEEFDLVLC